MYDLPVHFYGLELANFPEQCSQRGLARVPPRLHEGQVTLDPLWQQFRAKKAGPGCEFWQYRAQDEERLPEIRRPRELQADAVQVLGHDAPSADKAHPTGFFELEDVGI